MEERKKQEPLYRTIQQCFDYIHGRDKDSCITLCYIRKLVKKDVVKSENSGMRAYVNLTELLKHLGYEV